LQTDTLFNDKKQTPPSCLPKRRSGCLRWWSWRTWCVTGVRVGV